MFVRPAPPRAAPPPPSARTEALAAAQRPAGRPRSAYLLRVAAATLRDRSRLHTDMRLATAANEAYTASLAVTELLGCQQCGGGRGQDEVPGRGAGWASGRAPGRADRGCMVVASPPRLRTLTASENAPQGGRTWSNRWTSRPVRRGRLRLALTPQVKGAACQRWGDVFPP